MRYEAAGTLVTLSNAPTAVKAAASCYIELILKESDNNVKLIVLDRLIGLKEVPQHERVLQVNTDRNVVLSRFKFIFLHA